MRCNRRRAWVGRTQFLKKEEGQVFNHRGWNLRRMNDEDCICTSEVESDKIFPDLCLGSKLYQAIPSINYTSQRYLLHRVEKRQCKKIAEVRVIYNFLGLARMLWKSQPRSFILYWLLRMPKYRSDTWLFSQAVALNCLNSITQKRSLHSIKCGRGEENSRGFHRCLTTKNSRVKRTRES